MSHLVRNQKLRVFGFRMILTLLLTLCSLTSCNKLGKTTPEKAVQKTFASPTDAGAAFLDAAKSGDQGALLAIFGPDGKDVLFTGDPVKDKDALQDFVAAYNQMHRWREIKVGGEMLYIGADNYPFPIPLGQKSPGQWSFDTAAGKDEILARRIGKDELTAIAACGAVSDAQQLYFGQTHDGDTVKQYAQRFVADEGKQNGLYWHVPDGQSPSPLGLLGDFAKAAGYTSAGDKPQPFDGYLFRILTKQGDKAKGGAQDFIVNGKMTGGFAILAYPAEYRNSGIMTFVIGKDGIVYQKDLGEKTTDVASALAEYNPGDGWTPAI
ncbi:MAG: DUF2950 domain-containing protein [Candidatus Acidiferrales bacterium]